MQFVSYIVPFSVDTPSHGVYISQLIFQSLWFLDWGLLLNQGFLLVKLKSSLPKFYGRQHDLVNHYGISVSQMSNDMFLFSYS
jgi:hypothetical protein